MSEDLTRRAVLRRGAAATGAVTTGVFGLSGTAAASLDCPRTADEWQDHRRDFHRTREGFRLDRSGESYDADVAWEILEASHDGDTNLMLAKEIIAAQANIASIHSARSETCSEAVEEIGAVMEAGITWLDCSGGSCEDGWAYLADPDDYVYTLSWSDSRGVDGETIREELRAFNRGLHCDECGHGRRTGDENSADDEEGGNETNGGDDREDSTSNSGTGSGYDGGIQPGPLN